MRRAIERNASAVEPFSNAEVFEADGWICQLCFEPVDPALPYPDPMSKSLDHRIPLADPRGTHMRDNAQLAHLTCNVRKGASMLTTPTEGARP